MPTYGYRTYKARYWVAEVRTADDCSYGLTLIADATRDQAFRRLSGMRWEKTDRIVWLREIDESNTSDMQYYGFRETLPSPAISTTPHSYLDN